MLELDGVVKRYRGRPAVDRLSFTARSGTVTGFLGPNGAGKSTSLRLLLGLDRADAGRALVDGRAYADLREPLRHVGSLLDARGVVARRGARLHLLALARSNGLAPSRVDAVLEVCGLTDVADRPAGQFSLGMGQRLGIAAALLGDPPTLVLDEPVNGLDPDGIIWIRQLLCRLADEGRTVLLSSHLMTEMAMTATDLVVIGRGRLLAQTTVDDVVAGARGATVLVRTPEPKRLMTALTAARLPVAPDDADPATLVVVAETSDEVGRVAAAAGVVLLELTLRRPSLEDAYLQLVAGATEHRGITPTRDRSAA